MSYEPVYRCDHCDKKIEYRSPLREGAPVSWYEIGHASERAKGRKHGCNLECTTAIFSKLMAVESHVTVSRIDS
jgi:hypothetical protein